MYKPQSLGCLCASVSSVCAEEPQMSIAVRRLNAPKSLVLLATL